MWTKKAALSPHSTIGAIILIALILLIFGFYFFAGGLGEGRDIVLQVDEQYVSTSRLNTLLATPVEVTVDGVKQKDLVANVLVAQYKEDPLDFDQESRIQISRLLKQIPSPNKEVPNGWNLRLQKLPDGKAQDYVVTGLTQAGADFAPNTLELLGLKSVWLEQSTIIPFADADEGALKVMIYYACKTCSQEDMEGFE